LDFNTLVTFDNRSKSLGDIEIRQGPAYSSSASEPTRERSVRSKPRSRSACGHVCLRSLHEAFGFASHEQPSIDADAQETDPLVSEEAYEEMDEDVFEETSSPIADQDNEDDDEVENNWSPNTSDNSLLDQDTSLWSITTDPWSPSTANSPSSVFAAPPIPLPAPNNLTSTYLPFSSHLVLTNHLHPSTLTLYQQSHTPIFIHGMLQIPCTLAALLDLPTSDLLCHLTPAILLNHTTYLDAKTLLPSLVQSTLISTYQHVNGLLYFPKTSSCVDRLDHFFAAQVPKVERKRVTTQIQDSDDIRVDAVAWAWITKVAEGTEEWWTCEDYIAGRVVGLESVEW
jgi:hypothetical protein